MAVDAPVLGAAVSIIFFIVIVVAALTSSISLMEVGVAYLNERFGMKRWKGCILLFVICGFIGALCSLSFGPLAGVQIFGKGIFDFFDWLASNFFMLLLALVTTLFVGFSLRKSEVRDEITNGGTVNSKVFPVVYFLLKWVAPISIIAIFITNFIL